MPLVDRNHATSVADAADRCQSGSAESGYGGAGDGHTAAGGIWEERNEAGVVQSASGGSASEVASCQSPASTVVAPVRALNLSALDMDQRAAAGSEQKEGTSKRPLHNAGAADDDGQRGVPSRRGRKNRSTGGRGWGKPVPVEFVAVAAGAAAGVGTAGDDN